MRLPANNRWTQLNDGDIFGFLHETENVSLDSNGKIKLSQKSFVRYSSDDDANFEQPLAIVYYGGQYIIVTTGNAFRTDFGSGTTTETTLTTDVQINSDAVVCYARVYISTNDNLDYYDGSLTAGVYATTASLPHPLCVFDSQTTYKLALGNGNTVVLLNSSHSVGATLTIPTEYEVTTLAYRNGYLYVGTRQENGGEAKIFVWDGVTGSADYEIPTGASQVYSLTPYGSSVAVALNSGAIGVISGNTLQQIAAFPVYYYPNVIWDNTSAVANPAKILHRGMTVVGRRIFFNVDGSIDSGNMNDMPHGIWVYDPDVGLYHRSHHTADNRVAETPSALASNTLTISTHYLKTGDVVVVTAAGSLTGLTTGQRYYAKVESSTTIKLALTRKALQAGNYVTIGGTVSGSTIQYVQNNSFACSFDTYSGPVVAINPEEPFYTAWESPIIWGARLRDTDGNAFYGIMSLTEAWNIGRFTTQRIYSQNVTEAWEKLYTFIDGCHLDSEEVIVKYKVGNKAGYPTPRFQGTWASATTMTSVSSTQDEDEWADLEVGDELTIVDGPGRGYTTHITAIVNNSGTYTVTVDESIGSASATVYFYADKFRKIKAYDNIRKEKDFIVSKLQNVKSSWIQFKVELRGYETEVAHMELVNKPDVRAV